MTTILEIVSQHEASEDADHIVDMLQEHGLAYGAAGLWKAKVKDNGKIALTLIPC